ncbi:MAG: hypothetical protein J7L34_01540 [Thermotogaceae bacterium]|nr:hypothetical protein [Thermotogaceae bacterium]
MDIEEVLKTLKEMDHLNNYLIEEDNIIITCDVAVIIMKNNEQTLNLLTDVINLVKFTKALKANTIPLMGD